MRTLLFALSALGLFLAPPPSSAQPAACIIETLAGGEDTPSGDGGPALAAELVPTDIAHGPDGALYIADFGHWSIRRIRLDGIIERVAGNGKGGISPDGTPALSASIQPRYLAFDSSGNLLFTDRGKVRKITGGVIETVAGNGSSDFSGDGGPAVDAGIGATPIVAAEPGGGILVAQADHFRIRRVTPNGIIQTIAGTGANTASGDGGPAVNADIGSPRALTVASDGSIHFWGGVSGPNRPGVRRIRLDGAIESHSPYFRNISDLHSNQDGNLFAIANEVYEYVGGAWVEKEDVVARAISTSQGGALLALVYFDNQIFRVDQGDLTLVAGVGRPSPHGDGGPAALAYVGSASGIAVASDRSVYFVDADLERVRRITPDRMMERFAGSGPSGLQQSGGQATETSLQRPSRVTVAPNGTVYISGVFFSPNELLLAVGLDGTVAAVPVQGGIPRRPLALDDIEADKQGNLILTYANNGAHFVRVLGDAPTNFVVDGVPTGEFAIQQDGDAFLGAFSAEWRSAAIEGGPQSIPGLTGFYGETAPGAVAAGPDGSRYWTSRSGGKQLWRILPNGAIDLIAGAPGSESPFHGIEEMTFGPDGHLYLADSDHIKRFTSPHDCPTAGVRPKIATFGVVNSADYRALSPGAVFALFGAGLGPQEFVGAVLTQEGKLPTELGGTRVLFNGVPAPLLFSSSGQVNGIVPFGARVNGKYDGASFISIPGDPVYAAVEYAGAISEQAGLGIYESWPGIFTRDSSGKGLAAAINQDDTVNGPANSAAPGYVVVLWATGAGLTNLSQQDGSINSPPLARPLLPVTVKIGGVPVAVEFAGAAPGLVAGVVQINVRIPADFDQSGELPIDLKVAAAPPTSGSNQPTIYVGP